MNFFKILAVINVISSWMNCALADGRITLAEALDLISELAGLLGLPLEFDVGEIIGEPKKEAVVPPDGSAVEMNIDPETGRPSH